MVGSDGVDYDFEDGSFIGCFCMFRIGAVIVVFE